MITSGFFESVSTDRTYTTESFNKFFEGIIAPNGIFENVGGGFAVEPAGDMTVNVLDGKATVNYHWVRSDAAEPITIDTSHTLYNRYDMIALRWDDTTRDVTLVYTKGAEGSAEEKPKPRRTTGQCEIALAYIYVKAGASSISAANIIDCRYDTDICGVIASLIEQVDTTGLYKQYIAKFEEMVILQQQWLDEQQRRFTNWFNNLGLDLMVDMAMRPTYANYITTREDGTQYVDVPLSLEYTEGDLLNVYVNGVLMIPGADYELMKNEVEKVPMVFFYADIEKDNIINFQNLSFVPLDPTLMGDSLETINAKLSEIIDEQNAILEGGV